MTKSFQVLFSKGLGLSQNTKMRVSAALVSCRRASLPNCSLMQQKAEQRDFRHAVLSKRYKPVLCAAARRGCFLCLWFLALDGVGAAGGVELAADRREHTLGHVEIAPNLDLVDLKRQVGGVARFDVQIVERRALIEVLRESVRVESDGLTAQVGQVVTVEVLAGAVEQVAFERLFRWPADSGRRYCRRRLRRSAAGVRIAGRTAPCRAICSKMTV